MQHLPRSLKARIPRPRPRAQVRARSLLLAGSCGWTWFVDSTPVLSEQEAWLPSKIVSRNVTRSLRNPCRLAVLPAPFSRFVAASYAAEDATGQRTGGFLLAWKDDVKVRKAFEAIIAPELYRMFTPGTHKIAQLELSMVLVALVNRPNRFRGRRGVFYVDNLAALMALIRGRSDASDLEHLSRLIHAAVFSLQTWIYWEWVSSKSNWADAISHLGRDDPWYRGNVSATFRRISFYFCGAFRCQQPSGPSSICECLGE